MVMPLLRVSRWLGRRAGCWRSLEEAGSRTANNTALSGTLANFLIGDNQCDVFRDAIVVE